MQSLADLDEQIVALLHDVLEDTFVNLAELRARGFEEQVIEAVLLLSHDAGVEYADYIERLARNQIARHVKLADLADNLRNNLRLSLTPEVRARITRYEAAKRALEGYEENRSE